MPTSEDQRQTEIGSRIEAILEAVIDDWYDRVSGYYVTVERLEDNPELEEAVTLKRFHDDRGHRIKFDTPAVSSTCGLRSYFADGAWRIEASLNNKVENFDIHEFRNRLREHYIKAGKQLVPTPSELKKRSYDEIFELDSNFDDAFKLEVREGKADIMRLAFRLNSSLLQKIIARPVASKTLVESFCVTPFRNIFASVYRQS